MKKKLILMISIFFVAINLVYAEEKDTVTFSKCVDGDTFKVMLKGTEYTVRMLAVDTPESVHPTKGVEYYGKEASEYTCNKVTKAKKIVLEYDENSEKLDKYDRLLAWVHIDGKLLQEELIENGYAKVAYLYDDYKYTNTLEEKQEEASAKNIGIWNEEAANEYNANKTLTDNEETSTKNDEKTDELDLEKIKNKIDSFTTIDIIIIVILLLIIVFIGDKTIKNKAKKQLKGMFK